MDIECGRSTVGSVKKDDTVSFQFAVDEQQDVVLMDWNNTFIPRASFKDFAGRNLYSVSATDCGEDDCVGTVFSVKAVTAGRYTMEMVPDGKGGMFKVDMMCSAVSMDEKGMMLLDLVH